MLARTVVSAVRRKLNDPDAKYTSDVQIAAVLDQHARMLYRDKVNADSSYGKSTYLIDGSDTSNIYAVRANVWSYWFPTWLYRVHGVWETSGGARTNLIPHVGAHERYDGRGWDFASDRSIEVRGFSAAPSIEVSVSKHPAPVHWGTVQDGSTKATELVLEPKPMLTSAKWGDELFPFTFERDGYLGAELELTVEGTHARNPRGQVAVVVAQTARWSVGKNAWTWLLTLRPGFQTPPKKGDSYEMHYQVQDMHANYLVMLAAKDIALRTANTTSIQLLDPILRGERAQYLDSLRPRQEQDPLIISRDTMPVGSVVDQDFPYTWPWGSE